MNRESLGPVACCHSVTGVGGLLIFMGVRWGLVVERQKSWPTAEAVVLESEFIESTESIELKVTCEYSVDGITYRRPEYTEQFESADSIPERYRAGARVALFYNPKDPNSVLLEQPGHSATIAWIGCGMFLVLWGLWFPVLHVVSEVLFLIGNRRADKALRQMKAAVFDMEEAIAGMQATRGKLKIDPELLDAGIEAMTERAPEARDGAREWEEEFNDREKRD